MPFKLSVEYAPQDNVRYQARGRCEAPVLIAPGTIHKKERKCWHHWAYIVDGRKLCALHAGQECLKEALKLRPKKAAAPSPEKPGSA